MNHWPDRIGIWHEESLGQGDLSCCFSNPISGGGVGVPNDFTPWGYSFIYV